MAELKTGQQFHNLTGCGCKHIHACCTPAALHALHALQIISCVCVCVCVQVENPIPFAEPLTARLTTGFLHAKYFHLLLFPLHLSADWSFACVPYVQSLADPRNAATAALYSALVWVVVSSKPWQVVQRVLQGGRPSISRPNRTSVKPGVESPLGIRAGQQHLTTASPTSSSLSDLASDSCTADNSTAARQHESVWQMVIVVGLVIAPFFPAANILFYVGTFIGERLLYLPSVGYCLLLAHHLVRLMGTQGTHTVSSVLSSIGLSTNAFEQDHDTAHANDNPARVEGTSTAATAHALQSQRAEITGSRRPGKHGPGQQMPQGKQPTGRQPGPGGAVPVSAHVRSWLGLALLSMLLLGYSWRTVTRNLDWEDEETLFVAAQKVIHW